MRIELTQDITSSAAIKVPQCPITLGQGEVIRASVVSVQGETVSLKTEDGRVFNARLQSGTVLMEHDAVELMAGGGTEQERPVLRVVFVEPGQSGLPTRETSGVKAQTMLTQQLAEAFRQINIKPTTKLASLAAEILKNYPADARTAAFFAANNIPATQESIRAFQAILDGKQFGSAFYEIAQDTAAALEQATVTAAAEGQTGIPQTMQSETGAAVGGQQDAQVPPLQENPSLIGIAGQEQGNAGQAPGQSPVQPQAQGVPVAGQNPVLTMEGAAAQTIVQAQPHAQGEEHQSAPATGKPAPALQGEQASNQTIIEQPNLQQTGIDNATKQAQPQQTVSNGLTEEVLPQQAAGGQPNAQPQVRGAVSEKAVIQPRAEQAGILEKSARAVDTSAVYGAILQDDNISPKELSASPHAAKSEEKALLKELLDLFAKTGEDLDAQALKKSVEETPQKLLELQKLIKNTDIHTQESLASRFEGLTAQAKLGQDISRFVFVQIPIHLKEYGSAELYIYKRNRREKGADRQSTSVVLGLSTQNLGRVEAMLRIENRDISLDLRVQNKDALKSFQEGVEEIQKTFSELHYQLKEYKVAPLREPTTPLNAEEKLVRMHRSSGAGLDVMI